MEHIDIIVPFFEHNRTWAQQLPGRGLGCPQRESGSSAPGVLVVVLVIKKIPMQHSNSVMMVIIIYLMIINIENTYICGFRSCRIFSPLSWIFLDFSFSRKALWEQVTTVALLGCPSEILTSRGC